METSKNIPIIGIEDQPLYLLSRDYALLYDKHPNKYFYSGASEAVGRMLEQHVPSLWQKLARARRNGETIKLTDGMSVSLSNRLVWNFTYGAAWGFICTARNQEMAKSLLAQMRKRQNSILFAGSGHLLGGGSIEFEAIRLIISELGNRSPFGTDAFQSSVKAVDQGIYHFLRDQKVGFTFIDPEKLGDLQGDSSAYYKLFQAQQEVDTKGMSYEDYVNFLLQKRSIRNKTTVRPSPETAADFVKKLKEQEAAEQQNNVIFERKEEEEDRPHWSKTSHDEVWDALTKDSIWNQPSIYQGRDYEQLRVANLGSNCPVIDDIVIDAQTVTSMKTLDLQAPSYQNVQAIESRVSGYIDKLSGFTEVDWNGCHFERGVDFQDRILEVGIPAGSTTAQQIGKLVDLQEYAQTKDITLVIIEVP